MAITYPLTLPDIVSIQETQWDQKSIVGVTQSPFSGAQQVQAHDGKWWSVRAALVPKTRDSAEDWVGWFVSLNGPEGTFLLGDPHGTTPRGSAATAPGTPLVDGASQTGDQLAIKGAPNGAVNYLKRGDWIQLGSASSARLYRVTQDATADGGGDATLEIWPDLRSAPGDGDSVTVSSTVGVFRLTQGFTYRIDREHLYAQGFSAIEAF